MDVDLSALLAEFDDPRRFEGVMLFGSETAGVSDELLRAADLIVGIPMYGINHSFPVTVACSTA